ncbi:DUF429 domain-containing protein [Jatrophihabitans sp. YIM 134969]
MTRVVGVDGCRGGWLAAVASGRTVEWHVLTTFDDVLDLAAGDPLGVDMPLPPFPAAGARRRSDLAARGFLGPARSSIFWTPPADVLERWRRDPVHPVGIGVSIQTWNLLPKIAEVQDALSARPRAVLEVHPECSFRALAPGVAFSTKKRAAGRRERIEALTEFFDLPDAAGLPRRGLLEDALDATAAAWSALRYRRGTSFTLPPDPAPGEPVIVV